MTKKILDEKYSKINEQNKRFENPHNHIFDKYRNPDSPYFRNDLTKMEREAALSMELSWLRTGKGGQYNFNDAVFRNESIYDPTQAKTERNTFNRQKINEQLHSLFSNNGIVIPDNTNLRFTIDPNNFRLIVTGTKDESLVNQLESLLNTDHNARELFFHIMKTRSDDSTQFTPKSLEKFHLVNQIKTVTGYNLKDLEIMTENSRLKTEEIFLIYIKNNSSKTLTQRNTQEWRVRIMVLNCRSLRKTVLILSQIWCWRLTTKMVYYMMLDKKRITAQVRGNKAFLKWVR